MKRKELPDCSRMHSLTCVGHQGCDTLEELPTGLDLIEGLQNITLTDRVSLEWITISPSHALLGGQTAK